MSPLSHKKDHEISKSCFILKDQPVTSNFELQGVSPLTVIYNIQNTQIWVITQEIFFIFRNHRKINFHLKVSEGNLDHILCPKMHNFGIGQFQLLGYQISAKFKK